MSYEQGWNDAFKAIADYVEKEVCPVTGEMIRRMKDEKWRFTSKGEQPSDSHETVVAEEP